MTEPMIAVKGVARTFGAGATQVNALTDITFSVLPGEMVALVGRSGSGKTTLLNIVGGLDLPDAGHVFVSGTDVGGLSEGDREVLRRDTVAYIFQGFGLVPELSATENVGLPLRLRKLPAADRERRVALLLDLVGLGGHGDHRPDEMSGGQMQRVAIARALAGSPACSSPTSQRDSLTPRLGSP